MLLSSTDTVGTLMHLLLFTNSAERELVSICTQSIHNRNWLSLPYILALNVLQIYPLSVLKTCPISVMQIYSLSVLQKHPRLHCKQQNVFCNNVLNFVTKKVLWKKVLEIKSLWKQSPTIFRLYFLGIFFWFQHSFIQKRSRKKVKL